MSLVLEIAVTARGASRRTPNGLILIP